MVIVFIAMLIILCFTPALYSTEIDDNSMNFESFGYVPGTYLIDTEWGQWGYYNDKCPMNECDPDPAEWYQERLGCWSVAIGQIINYHSPRHPDLLQSTGIVSYDCSQDCINRSEIRNNLDEYDYDWSRMDDKLMHWSGLTSKDNVSRLLYDTATVIQKDFGTKSYFTTDNMNNLTAELMEHFPAINERTRWDDDLTEDEIKFEIDHNRPIMFYTLGHNYADNGSSFGHAMVIDGYDYVIYNDYPAFYIHLNFGWDGSPDPLVDSWYYYYGNFPGYEDTIIMDRRDVRKGLKIWLSPWITNFEGPIYEVVDGEGIFTISCEYDSDPPMFFMLDWDDGTPYEWLGPYKLGTICNAYHSWNSPGIYNVRVKAKNYMGCQSDWSEPITIHITRDSSLIPILELLLLLVDLIPSLEPYLSLIIWFICS